MLVLTRRLGQSLVIVPGRSLDPATPVGELFEGGPITVSIMQITGVRVRLSIAADPRLLILREELIHDGV